ncbi:MAG: CTP synthase [Bacilli bacterium]
MAKFIFVTGGVVSSLGKGIVASSIGRLLKSRGLKIFMQKFDPYINVDPGTLSPYQHGEVYVTDDGAETDLDLGHYERFTNENLTKLSNITTGRIYQNVIKKEREGKYLGKTVQVIPHITNEIKEQLKKAEKTSQADVIITEIGGTVGDIESLPFLEAIRQFRRENKEENVLFVHCVLLPYLQSAGEMKTKPAQHSVKELGSLGIQPDIIVLRSEKNVTKEIKEKISLFCDVPLNHVITCKDVDIIYEVVLSLKRQNIDKEICDHFSLSTQESDTSNWEKLIQTIKGLKKEMNIAIVGKYVSLHDAYLSVNEAIKAAGYRFNYKTNIVWINSEDVNKDNVHELLKNVDGVVVPGGFGKRGSEGKIYTLEYCRINKIPLLGICFGMQLMAVEFARNVLGYMDADSTELNEETTHPIIHLLPNQYKGIDLGGTLRLGAYNLKLDEDSKVYKYYHFFPLSERHRHRYEFNNEYFDIFNENGLKIKGINPESGLVEVLELDNHPYYVSCQFHPEFKSRPNHPHPFFLGLIEAVKNIKENKNI